MLNDTKRLAWLAAHLIAANAHYRRPLDEASSEENQKQIEKNETAAEAFKEAFDKAAVLPGPVPKTALDVMRTAIDACYHKHMP